MSDPLRVAMWSGPRNISTAMMRAWESRGDTAVWDEPFYAYYLAATGLEHPMAEAVIAAGETDWRAVVARILGPVPGGRPIFFQKHMTHHLLPEVDRGWLREVRHCFLIRAPREVVASYARARAAFGLDDVGVVQQAEIHAWLEAEGIPSVIVDARDVLERPRRILEGLCEALGVAFRESMLSWPPGPRPTDGVWGAHWYANVRSSTGFAAYRPRAIDLPPELEALAARCEPLYRALHARRLRGGGGGGRRGG